MGSFTDENRASRRDLLLATAGGLALALTHSAGAANHANIEPPMASVVPYVEHRITSGGHTIYAREYPGQDPAFVMMHGFPDNLHIYDYLIPHLTHAGRRVVVFDFLGFGQSEKVAAEGYQYTFKQQVGDLAAVVDTLKIGTFVPVGHDSGGPCAANYALDNPDRVAWLCLMNCYYSDSPTWRLPEIIEVFGDPWLRELAHAFLNNPDKMGWLITFQDKHFQVNMPLELRERFDGIVRPIVDGNFAEGAGPAFAQMTAQVRESVAYNTSRLPDVRRFAKNVNLIWGVQDPYLTSVTAAAIAATYPKGAVKSVEAGHWLMIDKPAEVAQLLLTSG